VPSPQTLTEADRRTVATWAADCAEHVLDIFEVAVPGDSRPRDLIARARSFARGELDVTEGIRRRFEGGVPIADMPNPAAGAAARSAGQAAAVVHMGAHALGAAAYAGRAAELAAADRADALSDEIRWQIDRMSEAVRSALRLLPPVGENASGPLGPGLLNSGPLRKIVAELQASLADSHNARATTERRQPPR